MPLKSAVKTSCVRLVEFKITNYTMQPYSLSAKIKDTLRVSDCKFRFTKSTRHDPFVWWIWPTTTGSSGRTFPWRKAVMSEALPVWKIWARVSSLIWTIKRPNLCKQVLSNLIPLTQAILFQIPLKAIFVMHLHKNLRVFVVHPSRYYYGAQIWV